MVDFMSLAAQLGGGGIVALAAALIGHKATTAVHGTRIESLEAGRKEHSDKFQTYDSRFNQLHTEFVPRTELTAILDNIRDSQKQTQRWIEFMVLGKVPKPPSENQD